MKLNIRVISLVLVLLLTLLALGGSGVFAESSEISVSGTLRVSSLPDGATVLLTGDTTMVLDEPRSITSIRGDHSLTLRGSEMLTVQNPAGDAINVNTLTVHGSVTASGEFALHTAGDITVEQGPVNVEARSDGICSEFGAVRLSGKIDVAAGGYGIFALKDVRLDGDITTRANVAACSENGTLYANGTIQAQGGDYGLYGYAGVEVQGGTAEASGDRRDAIRAQAGEVRLAGEVRARGGENGVYASGDVTLEGTVDAGGEKNDGIRAQGGAIRSTGSVTAAGGGYGLYAQKDVSSEGGSIDAEGKKNDGIRAHTGAINLKSDVKARGGMHGMFAHGDLTVEGKTDALGTDGSGVFTDGSASLSGEILSLGREYGVYARTDAALNGSGQVIGSSNDGVRAHTGSVTLSGDLFASGLYGVFGGSGVTMTDGVLEVTSNHASAIVSEYGPVSLTGTVTAIGAEYGVYAYTDLDLSGTVEADGLQHDGIHAHTGTVTVAADVTAKGPIYGIFGGGGVTIRRGNVIAGENASAGVYSEYGPVYISGELTASGSEYGVYAYTDVTVENARVHAESPQHDGIRAQTGSVSIAGTVEARGELYGVYACSGLSLSRGSLIAEANKYDGIYAISGSVNINGDVTASGGYYGIYADGDVTVGVGTVNATGRKDAGIVAGYGTVKISGHVTARGGEYGVFCDQFFQLLDGGTLVASGGNYDGINVRSGPVEIDGETNVYGGCFGIFADAIDIRGGNVEVSGGSSGIFSRNSIITIDRSLRLTQPDGARVGGSSIVGSDGQPAKRVIISDPSAPVNPFDDVPKDSYYYDPVMWAVDSDPPVTTGTSEITFSPDATCTRAQAVTFLWRARGCPEPTITECAFEDVAEDAYYYKAVLWAVERGITIGTSETTFSPELGCTRAHVVTFLHREQHEPAPESEFNPFSDVAEDVYYYLPVLWAVERGITNGTTPTTFSPHSTCTRAQIVTFLYRDMVYETK